MMRSKTLNTVVFLSVIALPGVAASKSHPHLARLSQLRPTPALRTADVLTPPITQPAASFRPVLASAVYRPSSAVGDPPFAGGVDGSDAGRGIWMQIAAGCGLLVFGVLRRLAGF